MIEIDPVDIDAETFKYLAAENVVGILRWLAWRGATRGELVRRYRLGTVLAIGLLATLLPFILLKRFSFLAVRRLSFRVESASP